jgi:hypothetical protein
MVLVWSVLKWRARPQCLYRQLKCLCVSKTESYGLSRICFEMTRQATMPSSKVWLCLADEQHKRVFEAIYTVSFNLSRLLGRKTEGLSQKFEDFEMLGSMAGPVIQATGRSEFEDGLGSGDFVSWYSYHMSVSTSLPDKTKQTKFQSQQPSDVKNTCSL